MKKLCLIFLFFLGGCNFRPQYNYDVEMPCSWRVETAFGEDTANLRWWQQFQDPILDELMILALQNNLDIKMAAARVCEYYAKFRQEAGNGLPLVGVRFGAERVGNWQPYPGGPIVSATQFKLLGAVYYELDLWGKLRNKTEARLDEYFSKVEARKTVILTLVSNLASAYIQLRALDQQLIIANKTWHSRQNSLRINKLQYDEGLVSKLEIEQSETEVASALAEVKKLEKLIPQQENLISVLIGQNPTCILRGRPLEELILPPCIPADMPVCLLQRRPDILEAEDLLLATEAQIGVARANFLPEVSLTAFFGKFLSIVGNSVNLSPFAYDIGMSVSYIVMDGGKKKFELLETMCKNEEAYYNYKSKILDALREVNDALIGHQKSLELVEVSKREVKAFEEYFNLAKLQYENGLVDYLNVVYAKNNLFASELTLATRQADTFTTLIELYKALGGGWVIDAENLTTCSPLY